MKKNSLLIMIAMVAVLLGGCGREEKFKDLRQYISSINTQMTGPTKQKQKSIPQAIPTSYKKETSRTPFDEMATVKGQLAQSSNPLGIYPLNLLRFVGTIEQNNKVWAYIMTPDNKIYRVTMGDTVGDHSGTIMKISPNKLEVMERATGEGTTDTQRIVTLQLREETTNE